jgi:diguanylate cyclase (GGDEF)-like protein
MNAAVATSQHNPKLTKTVDTLLSELEHYRKQSETLQKVNILHQRLSGVLDLPTMLETYSIWMMEHIDHDLIGYYNPTHEKMHMYCSSHGPERRHAVKITEHLLRQSCSAPQKQQVEDFFAFAWHSNSQSSSNNGTFVMIRKNAAFTQAETAFLEETLSIVAPPIKRALEFEEVFYQARRDTLTSLPNRFVFEERIVAIMEQAKRYKHQLTLAALDLDHFKAVNDTMGHLQGDKVLQQVAVALNQEIRGSDLLVRMGGDEFLLVLPDTNLRAAEYLAERLCSAVNALDISTNAGMLGVSIGLSAWDGEMSKEQWLEAADDILYQAKARGKARIAVN